MANKITMVPLAGLVEDMAIYPRHAVDGQHVARLAQALRAGTVLPPLVADLESKRLVDGWHRARAYRQVQGAAAVVPVELRRYPTAAALLEDAVALNASHGRRLDGVDLARAVLMLEAVHVSRVRIAAVLHVPEARVETLRVRIAQAPPDSAAAVPGTTAVILKRSVAHLAGSLLSEAQVAAHAHQAGTSHLLQAHQLRDALVYDLVNGEDTALRVALGELHAAIAAYLADSATVAAPALDGEPHAGTGS